MVLDSFNLNIIKVTAYRVDQLDANVSQIKNTTFAKNKHGSHSVPLHRSIMCFETLHEELNRYAKYELNFESSKHSITIRLPSWVEPDDLILVRIEYETRDACPSIMWTRDQDGRECVFTIGHMLNNRSLFPCQDLPQAMSTWHCNVHVKQPTHKDGGRRTVLMTGESDPEIVDMNESTVYKYSSSFYMPASTFALAIGYWCVTHIPLLPSSQTDRFSVVRLFTPTCLKEEATSQLKDYIPRCFESACDVLGPYPLLRLDILIVPGCFDTLGMACPNLMFLSQSVLSRDLGMFSRVAHELCHTWFGIVTGPLDWTEEWLTEGVCCYLEDIVHAKALKVSDREEKEISSIRRLLKYKLLCNEIENTEESLQTLRPDAFNEERPNSTESIQRSVTNGLNQEKTFMQVHYLKGYFLLNYLENIAGKEQFLSSLKEFTTQHIGKLFTSTDFLGHFLKTCQLLKSAELTTDGLCREWLDLPDLPRHLKYTDFEAFGSSMMQEVDRCLSHIKSCCVVKRKRNKTQSERIKADALEKLHPAQKVLLIERLLEDKVRISASNLETVRRALQIEHCNAEVFHAWCELVIQNKCRRFYSDVSNFLNQHQAMGVYLYGEMVISEERELQDMAKTCYRQLETDMAEAPSRAVRAMLLLDQPD